MAFSSADRFELLTALHMAEEPSAFATFLQRFRKRVGAGYVRIDEQRDDGDWHHADAGDAAIYPPLSRQDLLRARPGRVYALAELDPDAVADGRIVRSSGTSGDQWLIALGPAESFAAADSALMAGLIAHLAIACDNLARLDKVRMALAAAETACARGGIGWSLLDPTGNRLAGHEAPLPATGRRLLVDAISAGASIAVADEAIAIASPPETGTGTTLLFRRPAIPIDRAAVFAKLHAVPLAQARLATALSQGASLQQAASDLGITIETARFYSKRLYLATGTSGQADLVRLFWTGTAALA